MENYKRRFCIYVYHQIARGYQGNRIMSPKRKHYGLRAHRLPNKFSIIPYDKG